MIGIEALCYIPIIICAIWAIFTKIKSGKRFEAFMLSIISVLLIVNGVIMLFRLHEPQLYILSDFWRDVRRLIGCLFVPCAYFYFINQLGRVWRNATFYITVLAILIVFLENVVVFVGDIPEAGAIWQAGGLDRHDINIIKDGVLLVGIPTDVIVVLIQLVSVTARVILFSREMTKLELVFSRYLKIFIIWAYTLITYIALTFVIPWELWQTTPGIILFLLGYSALTTLGYVAIARNNDISMLVTQNDKQPVQLAEYTKFNNDLAARARHILDADKLYLQPGLVMEQVVEMLGTNRTYFARMMRIEFGQTFTEYINNQRLKHSQELLLTTNKSVTEIAEESGFASASAYCRVFKRVLDTSPEAWKIAHRPPVNVKV